MHWILQYLKTSDRDGLPLKSFSCETDGLQLRPLTKDDEPLFHALYSDPETMRFIGDPWTPAEATKRFQKIISGQDWPTLMNRYLVIVRKSGSAPMGICGTSHYDPVGMRLEVGIVLLLARRGLGIGRESLTALVGRVFEESSVDEIYVRFAVANIAMRNLLLRVGFRPGEDTKGAGQNRVVCEWSIHRSSWCSGNSTILGGNACST